MKWNIKAVIKRLKMIHRFTIVSFIVIISGSLWIGRWLEIQIQKGVLQQSAETAGVYIEGYLAPNLQELEKSPVLSEEQKKKLGELLETTSLGRHVIALKVWDLHGRVMYSNNETLIGRVFPMEEDYLTAMHGEVIVNISDLSAEENVEERKRYDQLLEIYIPIRAGDSDKVIAVAEFYQNLDDLNAEINILQRQSHILVGVTMAVIYLALAGFMGWTSKTIDRQEGELQSQVTVLTKLLSQNNELHERVQRAAANTAELNERFLRRISAELHDGPVQELGLALLRLDRAISQQETHAPRKSMDDEHLLDVQTSLQNVIREVRALATGLGLPELDGMSFQDILDKVIRSHERKLNTRVDLVVETLPKESPLAVKITAYRIIQEALNNAYYYAGGEGQKVRVDFNEHQLNIEVSDQGPGFDASKVFVWEGHLGLAGMRERVESLGGTFEVISEINRGTRVIAQLPVHTNGDSGVR